MRTQQDTARKNTGSMESATKPGFSYPGAPNTSNHLPWGLKSIVKYLGPAAGYLKPQGYTPVLTRTGE